MTGRTRKCNDAIRTGLLKKAKEFYEAAVVVEDAAPNAAVDLFVDAGIAAADVICCFRLGVYAAGGNHSEAVSLLEMAEAGVAKYLRTLLNLKSKVAYTHESVSTDDLRKASRAAENLVEGAGRIGATGTHP